MRRWPSMFLVLAMLLVGPTALAQQRGGGDPITVTSITLSPNPLTHQQGDGALTVTGTVTFTGNSLRLSDIVLSSSRTDLTTLGPLSLAAARDTATFTLTVNVPTNQAPPGSITISASDGSSSQTAQLAITGLTVSSLAVPSTIGPLSFTGTGTVTVSAPVQKPSGFEVTVKSNRPQVLGFETPGEILTVTVPRNQTTATFPLRQKKAVAENELVTITAGTQTAQVTLLTAALDSVSLAPADLVGGAGSTGTVGLNGKAPEGGKVIQLTSADAGVVTVPASVTIAKDQQTATFPITSTAVGQSSTVRITASLGGDQRTRDLTVKPPSLSNVALAPADLVGGAGSTGTVRLNGKAPEGGTVIQLTSADAGIVTVPASVTVAKDQRTATFPITSTPVAQSSRVSITASLGGVQQTGDVTVKPPSVSSVTLNPASVAPGKKATAQVTLNGAAPDGFTVQLASTAPAAASVPASVTVPKGQVAATFEVTTVAAVDGPVVISAKAGGTSKSADLSVVAAVAVGVKALAFAPTSLRAGASATGTLTLTAPAPAGGLKVALKSSNSFLRVPSDVTVAAGSTTATFSATAAAGNPPTAPVTVEATLKGGAPKAASLTITR